jgi:hypothetical protein
MKNDLKEQGGDRLTTMENKLKAVIQQYNNRMIGDRLVVDRTLN